MEKWADPPRYPKYRVTLVVDYLGWVDLDMGSSLGWRAAIFATYCTRNIQHPSLTNVLDPSPTNVLNHQ